MFADSGRNIHEKLSQAFFQVVDKVFPLVEHGSLSTAAERRIFDIVPNLREFYPRGYDAAIRTGTPEQQAAMNELWHAIQEAVETSHRAGIERGKSLLVQLAKGKITTEQFNNCSLEEDKPS